MNDVSTAMNLSELPRPFLTLPSSNRDISVFPIRVCALITTALVSIISLTGLPRFFYPVLVEAETKLKVSKAFF